MRNLYQLLKLFACASTAVLVLWTSAGTIRAEEIADVVVRLRERRSAKASTPSPRPTTARVLSGAETQRIINRFPPLSVESEKPPAGRPVLRERSLPRPRTGKTITSTFPPKTTAALPPETSAAALEVLRVAPEGPVPLAPHLAVTFSQPMIAASSQEQIPDSHVPVRITPKPPGTWRWVGTKTLLLESEERLPMATDYEVEVPAGVHSAVGGSLAQAKRWTFSTPPPSVTEKFPSGESIRSDPLFFVAFDQRIDPSAVLATIRVVADSEQMPLRLAAPGEFESPQPHPERWVVFRCERPLPLDTDVKVIVGPGTPSAEGPKQTATEAEWEFHTYGPLRVTRQYCDRDQECSAFDDLRIELSNPIDVRLFRKAMVRIDPPFPKAKVDVYSDELRIRGAKKGRTIYRVTLSSDLTDTFGQTLGEDTTVTFTTRPMNANVWAAGGNVVVLDPVASPRFSVYSINQTELIARAYVLTPDDWMRTSSYPRPTKPPGRLAFERVIRTTFVPDETVETSIDLAAALKDGTGLLFLTVEPRDRSSGSYIEVTPYRVEVLIAATKIGLDAFADGDDLIVWATSLADGRPLAGAEITLFPAGITTTTASDGLARFELPERPQSYVVARQGNDVAFLSATPTESYRDREWKRADRAPCLRWYVFNDRGIYRPGEEVKVKGWVRHFGGQKRSDVEALGDKVRSVQYTLSDSLENEVATGVATVNRFGGFDLTLSLPKTINLGKAELEIEAETDLASPSTTLGIDVQEFRRPEFEVKTSGSEGPHFVGQPLSATVNAAYFAGGPLPNTEMAWRVEALPGQFSPPNRDDFVFGRWVPWWEKRSDEHTGQPQEHWLQGHTDGGGENTVEIELSEARVVQPWTVRAEAWVRDVNRQAWASTVSQLVHPASQYVGLRSERLFVQTGEPLRFDVIATDLDGVAVVGRTIDVRAERLDWEQQEGEWREKSLDPQTCSIVSASEPVRCSFDTKEGGTYRITATVTDDAGRTNQTQLRRWVAGGRLPRPRSLEQEDVALIPDRKEHRKGDVAEILVSAPFPDGEGLFTLRRDGIIHSERFTMKGTSHILRFPIDEAWTPNIEVHVDLVGAASRLDDQGEIDPALPPRPAYGAGEIEIAIPPHARTLTVDVTPHDRALAPGGRTFVTVGLRDVSGLPVANGEVALFVVDEAVLVLSGAWFDPLSEIYPWIGPSTQENRLRQEILLGRPQDLGRKAGKPSEIPEPPRPTESTTMHSEVVVTAGSAASTASVRSDFNPLAHFAASVVTGSDGQATVPMRLPDNLTRYRVIGVATDGARRFGDGESTITARMPLMARPSPPRFLNVGDRFELPVVVQNQTDSPLSVEVAVRAAGAVVEGSRGRRTNIPANDRSEIRFPVRVDSPGDARFQVMALSGNRTDASLVSVPVRTPATTEAFATDGQIDDGVIIQPIRPPAGAFTDYGGIEVTTSSTALQALTDALLYLADYPYECSEQISSRLMAVVALRDVLSAFQSKGMPTPETLKETVERDIRRLSGLQREDGGFGFWPNGKQSSPYVSIHVAHALARAQAKGFPVSQTMLDQSLDYLAHIKQRIPETYAPVVRHTLIAYAFHVRDLLGDRDPDSARALFREVGLAHLSFEAVGWLLPCVAADAGSRSELEAIRRHLQNRAVETATTAHFAESYGDDGPLLLHSNRRTDAILLEALIRTDPRNDLIPKLAHGLLAERTAGRWANTQENVFVLLALGRYFEQHEKETPDFVARAWLGERFAGEHEFRGRSTERSQITIPMRGLTAPNGDRDLTLLKDGSGRLYYRIAMRYAPLDWRLDPVDRGFAVSRIYQGVDDPGDVLRDAKGTWHVKAGARVRIVVSMVAPSRRYHVALVDPLPAGFEPLNPEIAATGTIPEDTDDDEVSVVGAPGLGGPGKPGSWWLWTRSWYDHQNVRDDRVEAFASLLWEGVYRYSYLARATTPGTFVVPPPKAEEMYQPETFGRGASERIVVE